MENMRFGTTFIELLLEKWRLQIFTRSVLSFQLFYTAVLTFLFNTILFAFYVTAAKRLGRGLCCNDQVIPISFVWGIVLYLGQLQSVIPDYRVAMPLIFLTFIFTSGQHLWVWEQEVAHPAQLTLFACKMGTINNWRIVLQDEILLFNHHRITE